MKKKSCTLVLIWILQLCFIISLHGVNVYVSNQGLDSNPGTLDLPFHTIAKGLSVIGPGDVVLIRGGTYTEHDLQPPSGTADAPVTIQAYNGETVIMDGEFNDYKYTAFSVLSRSHMVFDGLAIQGYRDRGLLFWDSSHITVRHCFIHHCGTTRVESTGDGISLTGSHFVIENNRLTYNCPDTEHGGSAICGWDAHHTVIQKNICMYNRGNGILVEDSHDVIVQDNVASFNFGDFGTWFCGGIWLDGGYNVTVRNNWFEGNERAGMEITDEEPTDPYGYKIYNNVCCNNDYGMIVIGIGQAESSPNEIFNNTCVDNLQYEVIIVDDYYRSPPSVLCNFRFVNNLAAQFDANRPALYVIGEMGPEVLFDFNLYYVADSPEPVLRDEERVTFSHYKQLTGWDENGMSADPNLADPVGKDFHTLPETPCFTAGSEDFRPPDDYDGVPRKGTPDIGAYEYVPCGVDFNGDCRIDALDLRLLSDYLARNNVELPYSSTNADCNQDNRITVVDLTILVNYLIGHIPFLPTDGS